VQPPPPKQGMPGWVVTLIVLGIAGPMFVGILAVLGIYGVRKYIGAAKQAEARNAVGEIAKLAGQAYEVEAGSAPGPSGLCASASRSVPARAAMIRGMKYQSAASDWSVDASRPRTGFACLKFEMDAPQYYMYSYRAHGSKTPGDTFTATANGDLDGDGDLSTFAISGEVDPGGQLVIQTAIAETNPAE